MKGVKIDRLEAMPGDVILTTRTGAVPALLRAAAGVPVSHAAIMVTADYAIEARDDAWDLSDSGGQVYVRSLDEVLDHPEIELVVVRRPPQIDEVALTTWAVHALRSEVTFATAGLAMAGVLKLRLAMHSRAGRAATRFGYGPVRRLHTELAEDAASWAEAVADGFSSVVCTELVYRALLASGCELDLQAAYMREAMVHLPRPVPLEMMPIDDAAAVFQSLAEARPPEPVPPLGDSKDNSRLFRRSLRNLRERIADRLDDEADGDWADLVTPGDLYRLPPLETVTIRSRDRSGSWVIGPGEP